MSIPRFEEEDEPMNVLSQCDPSEAPHLFGRSQMLAMKKTITSYDADSRCEINWFFAFDEEV